MFGEKKKEAFVERIHTHTHTYTHHRRGGTGKRRAALGFLAISISPFFFFLPTLLYTTPAPSLTSITESLPRPAPPAGPLLVLLLLFLHTQTYTYIYIHAHTHARCAPLVSTGKPWKILPLWSFSRMAPRNLRE